jgi:aminoethylphosphonate catabolism LysR family transcriptional regulator
MMNFTQLRAFDAVAREGSFSKAAAALGVTQPALTIQVKALEDTYGIKLFERSGRSVAVTDLGRSLFDLTRRLFGVEEQAEELLTASRELRRGNLRVAADGPHIVMGMFARFLKRYPSIRLSVSMGNTRFVYQQLVERRCDVAILPGVGDDPHIASVPLWHHKAALIVPLGHPWARRRSVRIHELEGQPMLMREEGSTTQRKLDAALGQAEVTPRVVLELGSREAVCEAVAAGLGVGLVWQIEAMGETRFKTLTIRDADVSSTDYVACLKNERNRPIVRAMVEIAEAIHETRAVLDTGHRRTGWW